MTLPQETTWSIEPHTKAKHEILKRYLQAWFPILSKYHDKIIYIDGFCGPGRYSNNAIGSPLIALDVASNHRAKLKGEIEFWFIDEKIDRINNLKSEINRMELPSHFTIHTECGKFQQWLEPILQGMNKTHSQSHPTFAFIDPFGFSGIPYSTIERLLSNEKCEILITLMVDAINRFIQHPEENIVRHIIKAFGTEEAIQIAKAPDEKIENLCILYQEQLKRVAEFVRYFEMKNANDRTIFFLFFASHNSLGHVKMKEAMWRIDPQGNYSFSDATNPGQLFLFGTESLYSPRILQILRNQFPCKTPIACKEIRKFIENHTPFLKKHMTEALKTAEKEGAITIEPVKSDKTPRRAGTFPDDAKLTFIE